MSDKVSCCCHDCHRNDRPISLSWVLLVLTFQGYCVDNVIFFKYGFSVVTVLLWLGATRHSICWTVLHSFTYATSTVTVCNELKSCVTCFYVLSCTQRVRPNWSGYMRTFCRGDHGFCDKIIYKVLNIIMLFNTAMQELRKEINLRIRIYK